MDKSVKRATPKNTAVRDPPAQQASLLTSSPCTEEMGKAEVFHKAWQTPEKHLVKVTKEIQDSYIRESMRSRNYTLTPEK